MKFRLVTTVEESVNGILAEYPQLKDKIEVVGEKAYITIEKVDDFMELAKLAGEIVVGEKFLSTNEPFIEIYDSYRE